MRNRRRVSMMIIVALLGGIIAGCGIVQVNPEKDRDQIIAQVNDETILKGQLLDQLDREKSYYNLTEQAIGDSNNKEQVLEIKKLILDQIITETLLNQKAKEAGFLVTDELREEAQRELDDLKENIRQQIEEAAQNSDEDEKDEDEDTNYEEQAEDYLENQLAAMGKTEEEYIEFTAQQKCIDKLFEKVVGDAQVSVDEISKYYEEELSKQKENPASIEGSPVVLYEPSRIRVKHVFIDIPEEKINEYNELLQQEKEDDAQELSNKELAAIKGKADGILVRAKGGEDFIKLVEEVNPSNVEMMEEGMVTYKDSPYLPDEYKEAAFKIEEGEISGLVKTPYGYYIIQVNEKLPETVYSQDDKKDDIEDKLTTDKENEKWKETVEEWKKVGIKKFEKRL